MKYQVTFRKFNWLKGVQKTFDVDSLPERPEDLPEIRRWTAKWQGGKVDGYGGQINNYFIFGEQVS